MTTYRFISTSGRYNFYKRWNDIEAESIRKALNKIFDDLFRVWDTDDCSTEFHYIRIYEKDKGIESEQFYKITYYYELDPDGDMYDDVEVERITHLPGKVAERLFGDRDWIIL